MAQVHGNNDREQPTNGGTRGQQCQRNQPQSRQQVLACQQQQNLLQKVQLLGPCRRPQTRARLKQRSVAVQPRRWSRRMQRSLELSLRAPPPQAPLLLLQAQPRPPRPH